MKAVPFIKTMLNEEHRLFLSKKFDHNNIPVHFKDWQIKDMVGWTKIFSYNHNITLHFYETQYKIHNNQMSKMVFELPYPETLDQFICDCERCLVDLHWDESKINMLDRIHFMEQTQIEKYNTDLLTKIEKS